MSVLAATATLLLHGWALHRAVGTKHAAVAGLRPERHLTILALVEELARVDRHGFRLGKAALRASQDGLESDGRHFSHL